VCGSALLVPQLEQLPADMNKVRCAQSKDGHMRQSIGTAQRQEGNRLNNGYLPKCVACAALGRIPAAVNKISPFSS
jgi:hypothetical protein